MREIIKLRVLVVLISILSGCTSTGGNVLPINEEMTTSEIYKIAMNENRGFSQASNYRDMNLVKIKKQADLNAGKSINTDLKDLSKRFKTLPNPQIAVYVFPHYARAGSELVPVMGYTTAFHLYKNNQFALAYDRYA